VKVLIVAGADRQAPLADAIAADFQCERAADIQAALELLANNDFDGLLLHFDIGAAAALELLGGLKRGTNGRLPGIVVVAREIDTRSVVDIMRAGAVDVLVEGTMEPREIPHALRNAAFCEQANARLRTGRRAPRSPEVLVIGEGDGVEAIVLLLEASGIGVRHLAQLPGAGDATMNPRAIVVDVAAAGDGEALLRLLKAQ
jgi:DNA-binding NtrC family response regulator